MDLLCDGDDWNDGLDRVTRRRDDVDGFMDGRGDGDGWVWVLVFGSSGRFRH
jgi:hypothetical protein